MPGSGLSPGCGHSVPRLVSPAKLMPHCCCCWSCLGLPQGLRDSEVSVLGRRGGQAGITGWCGLVSQLSPFPSIQGQFGTRQPPAAQPGQDFLPSPHLAHGPVTPLKAAGSAQPSMPTVGTLAASSNLAQHYNSANLCVQMALPGAEVPGCSSGGQPACAGPPHLGCSH